MDVLDKIRIRKEQDERNRRFVKAILPIRDDESYKNQYGKILIIAGSTGMCGASILCARSALRTGSGLVKVAIKKELFPILQVAVPEAMCIARKIDELDLDTYDAIVMGPGMGTGKAERELVKKVLKKYEGPLLLDADALTIVAEENLFDLLKKRNEYYDTVITPHMGEARRLLSSWYANQEDFEDLSNLEHLANYEREDIAEKLVEITDSVVLLKGHTTIITRSFGEEIYDSVYNTTGNPGMATGGSGDCLSGIIGSLLGQRMEAFNAARTGAYIHGLSGDLAEKEYGEDGLIASDIVKYIAYAIKDIKEN